MLSLVSRIPDQSPIRETLGPTTDPSGPSTPKPEQTAAAETRTSTASSTTVPAMPSGFNRGWLVVAALAACIAVWMSAENNKKAYSPPTYPAPRNSPAPGQFPSAGLDLPKSQPPAATEDMPVPGDGNRTLSQGNIRWGLFRGRRIEIIRSAIVASTDAADLSNFNSLVTDYNSRCERFRYRETDMSVVRGELLRREEEFRSEAERVMNSWPNRRQASLPDRRQIAPPNSPPTLTPSAPVQTPSPTVPTDREIGRN
jgi:hypothetical protein